MSAKKSLGSLILAAATERNYPPATLRKEVETCGLCHARRGILSEDWVPGRPLSDTHMVSPLSRGLYQSDGQMLNEVYNYGSFKQSKMFSAGVTCGDCHEPHSAKLRASGDRVCLQCHAPEKFAVLHIIAMRQDRSAELRVMPHAVPDLYGRGSAARSQLPYPSA